mgnify:CR=1 FL=1
MIYPVMVKKISVSAGAYCSEGTPPPSTGYIAFSPLTETISAVAPTLREVLKKITAEFAARVFDNEIEIEVIILGDEKITGESLSDGFNEVNRTLL